MRILFLAPQPFFQERGTPIAVRLALQVLADRGREEVDLLTYHEGETIQIPSTRLFRIRAPRWLSGIGPGISLKKLACDVLFTVQALSLAFRARREGKPYRLVHAVEEAVFVAWLIRLLFGTPYIYDMDSSLALQLTEKWWFTRPLYPLLSRLERLAVRGALTVVPVCDALAAIARRHGAHRTAVLHDISLLGNGQEGVRGVSLRDELQMPSEKTVLLYIGNLERYQGIDLMIESFAVASRRHPHATLVVIGGSSEHIRYYSELATNHGVGDRVRFLGSRPLARLSEYLSQADILVSPRTKGNNTPMKIYSYLHSGVPVLATELPTHTQVLHGGIAKLAAPKVNSFSEGMVALLDDRDYARKIGLSARAEASQKYTIEEFSRTLNQIYDQLAEEVSGAMTTTRPVTKEATNS